MELSSLASKLPSDACKHPEVSNVTMGPKVTSEENATTTTESPRVYHHHEEKKKKVSDVIALWILMMESFLRSVITKWTRKRKIPDVSYCSV